MKKPKRVVWVCAATVELPSKGMARKMKICSKCRWTSCFIKRKSEAKPKFNPDYLCGKPECEANTRGLLLEYTARIAELEAASENVLGQLHQREDELRRAVMKIAELEDQVKAMRCCGNCENGIVGQLDLENKTCMECADDDLWQPRAASKEG